MTRWGNVMEALWEKCIPYSGIHSLAIENSQAKWRQIMGRLSAATQPTRLNQVSISARAVADRSTKTVMEQRRSALGAVRTFRSQSSRRSERARCDAAAARGARARGRGAREPQHTWIDYWPNRVLGTSRLCGRKNSGAQRLKQLNDRFLDLIPTQYYLR